MVYKYLVLTLCSCFFVPRWTAAQNTASEIQPAIGVCSSLGQLAEADLAGFEFIIPGVGEYLRPTSVDTAFRSATGAIQKPPIIACNSFFPPHMKCVGTDVNLDALLQYAESAFKHAEQRGVPIIIFGSGAARKIPDGFDQALAMEQFTQLCKQLADLAASYNVKIALENLNREETNIANTVETALAICTSVNRPNFGINADIYHMLKEHEPPENLLNAGKYIFNCDIAEPTNRTPPGTEGTDFTPYLSALKSINYQGGIAVEARWTDFSRQSVKAYSVLKKQSESIYR